MPSESSARPAPLYTVGQVVSMADEGMTMAAIRRIIELEQRLGQVIRERDELAGRLARVTAERDDLRRRLRESG